MSNQIQSLYEKYQSHFPIGTCVSPRTLVTHQDLLIKHYNSLTSENHMKFGLIHPKIDQYDFTEADKLVEFARDHNKLVRGHTLVWHGQNPKWLFYDQAGDHVDRKTLLKRTQEHINTVVSRYKDDIYCWDVVNEAVDDKGSDILRPSPWVDIVGEDFIEKAFEYAHAVDPKALLFYNDYNESTPAKRDKIYKLVKGLKDKDIPIHGVGLQAHWNIYGPSLDEIREAIEKYASLGVQLHITEMDVSVFEFHDRREDLTAPTEEMLDKLAERYDAMFKLFREYSEVVTNVTLWGPADDATWLDGFPVRNRKNWPLLFDVNHNPKQALERVIQF